MLFVCVIMCHGTVARVIDRTKDWRQLRLLKVRITAISRESLCKFGIPDSDVADSHYYPRGKFQHTFYANRVHWFQVLGPDWSKKAEPIAQENWRLFKKTSPWLMIVDANQMNLMSNKTEKTGRNTGVNKKGPHRCRPLLIWLPDLDSNQGPAD